MFNTVKSTNEFYDGYPLIGYEFSTLCDKNCSYCYNMIQHDKRFTISHQKIISDLDLILTAENSKMVLVLIGGETLLQPGFEDIIDHIAKIKKPETKILIFTHADHEFELFKSKIDKLKVFGDMCKVNCTLHWEQLNKEQFKRNVKYVNDNFKYKTLYFLLTPQFLNEENYIDSILKESEELKMYGLIFDGSRDLDLIKQVSLFKKLQKYNDRMDNIITINGNTYSHNIGMNEIYKLNKFSFEGSSCTVLDFDINKNGDVRRCCSDTPITNIRNNFDKSVFNLNPIICKEKQCMLSFSNRLMKEIDES